MKDSRLTLRWVGGVLGAGGGVRMGWGWGGRWVSGQLAGHATPRQADPRDCRVRLSDPHRRRGLAWSGVAWRVLAWPGDLQAGSRSPPAPALSPSLPPSLPPSGAFLLGVSFFFRTSPSTTSPTTGHRLCLRMCVCARARLCVCVRVCECVCTSRGWPPAARTDDKNDLATIRELSC